MSVPVLTAVTGATWESELVSTLEHSPQGLSVVRRCVDLADLLATAASGQARAVLLAADLRRLDRDAIARLAASRVATVGVITPGDSEGEQRLQRLGINRIVNADAAAEVLATAVSDAVEQLEAPGMQPQADRAVADPRALMPNLPPVEEQLPADAPTGTGQLVAVWGPTGAPGRTSVAVTLASEIALLNVPTLLADADVYGGVVAQTLGVLDESPGLAAACRSANNGTLDLTTLARHALGVTPSLRVLTGIQRSDRWPELRASSLEQVWQVARSLAHAIVVDCGFCLEQDEEISFDTAAPRRNGATLTTLESANVVVAVGSADPIGLQRLLRGLGELREAVPTATIRVVVNQVRSGPMGGNAEAQVRDALGRYAGVTDATLVPYDRAAFDRALREGQTLSEAASSSAARKALRDLAVSLAGVPSGKKRGVLRRT